MRMKNLAHVGRRLRRERMARGWSQAELAGRVGVGQSTVCRIESGQPTASFVLAQVASALGCELAVRRRKGPDQEAA